MELKRFSYDISNGTVSISVDSNTDGQPVLAVKLDVMEALDEVLSWFMNRKPKA